MEQLDHHKELNALIRPIVDNNLKILYLKDPSLSLETNQGKLDKYDVRTVLASQELTTSLEGFKPHILLCSSGSSISAQEVLNLLDLPRDNALIIISVIGENLEEVLPLLNSSSLLLKQREAEKASDEERLELEEKYKSIYHTSLDGILVTQPDGTILSANPAACRMLEMTEKEICRRGRAGLVDQEDPRLKHAVAQREKTGQTHTELTFIKKSGQKFPVELTSSVYIDAKGNLRTTIILRDISERKEVEEQLKISHESYKTMFYHSPIPYMIYDQNTLKILDVNKVAIDTYGYSREEFCNLSLVDLRPSSEVPRLMMHLKNTKNSEGISRYGKFIHLKKDGTSINVEVHGYRIMFNNRSCRLAACIDITEKEKTLERLKEKQARLTAAHEIAKIGYWELDLTSNQLAFSDMMYTLWGLDKQTFNPSWSSFKETIHPEDREKFICAHKDSLLEGKEHDLEYRIILPSGRISWIHERGKVLTWRDGQPQKIERTVQDITDQKIYLEKLTTSESRYRGIIQSQSNYLIHTDMEGNYTYYNNKFYADFGWLYDGDEIIGKPSLSSIMEHHHQAVLDVVQRSIMSPGDSFQIEIDKPKKNGGVRTTLWDFVCLINNQGEPTEIQCVGIDISDRVKAENQLKDSRLRYKLVTEATSDAIWDWDLKAGSLNWGKSFLSIFGYDPKSCNSIDAWAQLLHPDDRSRVSESLFKAIKSSETKWVENYRLKKKNRQYANVIDTGTILRDKHGVAYRAVGSLQDVTEKKKLEDLLEKANSLSRIGSFELDLNKNELYWSPMTRNIHEVDKNFHPDLENAVYFYKEGRNRNRIKKVLNRAIEKHRSFDEELIIVTGKRRELWVRVMAEPEIENGRCVRISGSFQDIDKIKRAELDVLKAAKEKEILLESIGDAFFAVDEHWEVTYWNKHASELLDCPKEKVLNRNLWQVFEDAVDTPFQKNYDATMRDRKRRQFEAFFQRTSAWYEVSVYPSNEGLSVFFRDITQRKIADVKLRELNKTLRAHTRELVTANKGLEQFSYIVSHNLRSPVANILGLADLLQHSEYPKEVRDNFFSEIFSNVERLDKVISDLNNILQAKVDVNAKKEQINLYDLVEEIKISIKHLIKEEEATLICEFGENATILSVRSYLYSIFYNLIVNSIKYRREDTPPILEINSTRKGEFCVISFRDNGLGIDLTNKRDQVFHLYKRFHHHIEGKGMGLFMVKTQLEMLGGKINIDSQVNEGTTFTILLKNNSKSTIEEVNDTVMQLSGSR